MQLQHFNASKRTVTLIGVAAVLVVIALAATVLMISRPSVGR